MNACECITCWGRGAGMGGWMEGETFLWICSFINVRNHLLIYLCFEQATQTALFKVCLPIMHLVSSYSRGKEQGGEKEVELEIL